MGELTIWQQTGRHLLLVDQESTRALPMKGQHSTLNKSHLKNKISTSVLTFCCRMLCRHPWILYCTYSKTSPWYCDKWRRHCSYECQDDTHRYPDTNHMTSLYQHWHWQLQSAVPPDQCSFQMNTALKQRHRNINETVSNEVMTYEVFIIYMLKEVKYDDKYLSITSLEKNNKISSLSWLQ